MKMFVLIIPFTTKLTIIPAIKTPISIAKNERLMRNSNKLAATVPVQAPVTGRGIATKRTSPQKPHFSTSPDFFSTRLNQREKKLPIIGMPSNLSKNNLKNKSKGTTGSKLPNTDKK
jgi:hypothetical protein